MSATAPAIRAENLGKTFKGLTAVDDVSLEVPRGTVFALLGPNGAGKTTTVRMLATLLRPNRGRAEIFGYDVVKQATAVRSMIGLTGQYASVDENLSANENLRIFGRLLGLSGKAAAHRGAELLEQFTLTEAANRPVRTLSGGMRRRLDIAATLLMSPPLIFLDEPTTGLDPRTRIEMWDTVRALVARGATILLTTQYLEEADALADEIAVVDRGRIVARGTANDLKASIGGAVLRIHVAQQHLRGAAVAALERVTGITAQLSSLDGEISLQLADVDLVTDILIEFRNHGIRLGHIGIDRPDLNEVFLAITGQQAGKE